MHSNDHSAGEDRPKFPRWALIVILVLGGTFIIGAVSLLILFASSSTPLPPQNRFPMAREAFKAKLMGKSMDQVLDLLGRPERTTRERRPGSEWTYMNKSRDPVSGQVDLFQEITFDQNDPPRVASVACY